MPRCGRRADARALRLPVKLARFLETQDPVMRHRWFIIGAIAALVAGTSGAQTAVPGLDLRVTQTDIEPSVTIQEFDNRTIEKYSVNNNTYMVKITPTAGAPYYLVDEDGSGEMAWRRGTQNLENNVPQWTLFSW
ncbi:MAG: DUF2782 domain-containing protein [Thiohalocapsa sp.]